VLQIDRLSDRDMNKPSFFFPTDDLHLDASLLSDPINQEIAIFGLPHRTCSDRTNPLHIKLIRRFAESQERIHGGLHRRFANVTDRKDILSQSHRDANIFDCFHLILIRIYASYHHSNGI
jgi:hypothetical protein